MTASTGGAPRRPQPSRSKTGKVLSDAEHRQRIAAAQSAARRRQAEANRALAKASKSSRGAARPAQTGPTKFTAGVGRPGSPGYVGTESARSAFISNGVSGADINQSKDPRSGFLNFSGKDPIVHQKFVDSLKQMGFRVAQRRDGSGYAVNAAGQGIRLGKPSTRPAPRPKEQDWKVNEETGKFEASNRVQRVSSRGHVFR